MPCVEDVCTGYHVFQAMFIPFAAFLIYQIIRVLVTKQVLDKTSNKLAMANLIFLTGVAVPRALRGPMALADPDGGRGLAVFYAVTHIAPVTFMLMAYGACMLTFYLTSLRLRMLVSGLTQMDFIKRRTLLHYVYTFLWCPLSCVLVIGYTLSALQPDNELWYNFTKLYSPALTLLLESFVAISSMWYLRRLRRILKEHMLSLDQTHGIKLDAGNVKDERKQLLTFHVAKLGRIVFFVALCNFGIAACVIVTTVAAEETTLRWVVIMYTYRCIEIIGICVFYAYFAHTPKNILSSRASAESDAPVSSPESSNQDDAMLVTRPVLDDAPALPDTAVPGVVATGNNDAIVP